jgi:AhpD family alkylhydroperoxidase
MLQQYIHTEESAPQASKVFLQGARKGFGFIPNLLGAMADAPSVIEGYLALYQAFDQSSFTPVERQVVLLTVSFIHRCEYCMSGHSMLAEMAGMDAATYKALREGLPIADRRLEALRVYTRQVLLKRARVTQEELQPFLAAGYTRQQVMEVNLGIALKTLSNYTNHIHPVPVDAPVRKNAWQASEAIQDREVYLSIMGWLRPGVAEKLARYQAAAGPVMKRYGGQPFLRMTTRTILSGKPADLMLIMQFPSAEQCEQAFGDAEYLTLLPLRDQVFERLDMTISPIPD